MDIAVMTDRAGFVKFVTTNSLYDEQHTEATKCFDPARVSTLIGPSFLNLQVALVCT